MNLWQPLFRHVLFSFNKWMVTTTYSIFLMLEIFSCSHYSTGWSTSMISFFFWKGYIDWLILNSWWDGFSLPSHVNIALLQGRFIDNLYLKILCELSSPGPSRICKWTSRSLWANSLDEWVYAHFSRERVHNQIVEDSHLSKTLFIDFVPVYSDI